MHISDVHDYSPDPAKVVEDFIAEGRRKQIQSAIEELVNDEFDRLEEYANEFISQTAASRAEKFLEKVLHGDDEAAMSLLGDKPGSDRYKSFGGAVGEPWCHLINGRLFETNGISLRREIVEAHADLLKSERVKDLEAVVDGLSRQVRKLEAEVDRLERNSW